MQSAMRYVEVWMAIRVWNKMVNEKSKCFCGLGFVMFKESGSSLRKTKTRKVIEGVQCNAMECFLLVDFLILLIILSDKEIPNRKWYSYM